MENRRSFFRWLGAAIGMLLFGKGASSAPIKIDEFEVAASWEMQSDTVEMLYHLCEHDGNMYGVFTVVERFPDGSIKKTTEYPQYDRDVYMVWLEDLEDR